MTIQVKVGDWICWKQMGLPSYARVEYIVDHEGLKRTEFVTTTGTCLYDDILEVRSPQEGA